MAVPFKNRQAKLIADAWKYCFDRLKDNIYTPEPHILKKKCSDLLNKSFRKYNIDSQRVTPHTHQQNSAEHSIQTWKHHFIAVLATYDTNFPPFKWDHFIPQCDITITIIISSRHQPRLSSHTYLYGNFFFNRSPPDLPGTKERLLKLVP